MTLIKLIFILLLFVTFNLSCSDKTDNETDHTIRFTGDVRSVKDSTPLEGVSVGLSWSAGFLSMPTHTSLGYTDSLGKFDSSATIKAYTSYTLQFDKLGWLYVSVNFDYSKDFNNTIYMWPDTFVRNY